MRAQRPPRAPPHPQQNGAPVIEWVTSYHCQPFAAAGNSEVWLAPIVADIH